MKKPFVKPLISPLLIILILLSTQYLNAQTKPDDIIGVWITPENRSHIEMFKDNGKYYGRIVWEKEPNDKYGKPSKDINNPNPKLRDRLLHGMVIVHHLVFDDGEWSGGKIYDPESGNEYKVSAEMPDRNTLKIRGYIGISLIGRSCLWVREK
jgi:uncharacterized protein (DUF2147 family)